MPGLDPQIVNRINIPRIFNRIRANARTDLIVAPHYDLLYKSGQDALWQRLRASLSSGTYEPDLPILMDIPKPRGFNRPGGIPHPWDRIVYQMLADELVVPIEASLDRSRVFSTVLLDPDPEGQMFESVRDSYSTFQSALLEQAECSELLVQLDIANYYERLPQHSLVNILQGIGCDPRLVNLLEKQLLGFQQNQSIGIVQGLLPSDLLGNFYLSSFDAQCEMRGLQSVRFVDDIYISGFQPEQARPILTWTIDRLRRDALHLNEGKSGITTGAKVIEEESEVRDLFLKTANQLRESGLTEDFWFGYGFRVDSDDVRPVADPSEVDAMSAQAAILDLLEIDTDDRPDLTAKIDKFSIPILTSLANPLGLSRALKGVQIRPYLAQIYAVYVSEFVSEDKSLVDDVMRLILLEEVGSYERMVLLAALQRCTSLDATHVRDLLNLVDSRNPDPVRALCAIVAAKFGTAQRQRVVKARYEDEGSPYMRSALLYAAQWMSSGDKNTCKRVWGSHSGLNSILASLI